MGTYTEEVQNSMSIDTAIEASLSTSFFEFFDASLGVSVTTGYDWTQTSRSTKSEAHSFGVQIDVPPGYIVIIDGAVGDCDGSVAKTELFRITSYDSAGKLVKEEYEKTFANGTTMPFQMTRRNIRAPVTLEE